MATYLFITFVVLQLLDIYTTSVALKKGAVESNPILDELFHVTSVLPALIIVKGILIYLTYNILDTEYISPVLVGLIALYTWVVVNNIKVIKNQK